MHGRCRGDRLGGLAQRFGLQARYLPQVAGGQPDAEAGALAWLLWALMSPPIARTKPRLMVRPRPVAPKRRVVEASACTKGSNTDSNLSAGMPMPVSMTSIT